MLKRTRTNRLSNAKKALECTFQRFFRMQKAGTAFVLPRLLVIISFPRVFPA